MTPPNAKPLAILLQPACLSHKWIRTADTPHLMERPERIRAVMVGVAAAVANLEQEYRGQNASPGDNAPEKEEGHPSGQREVTPDISSMLGGLSLNAPGGAVDTRPGQPSDLLYLPNVSHPDGVFDLTKRGKTLLRHPALQYTHSETPEAPFPSLIGEVSNGAAIPTSTYLPSLLKWCVEAPEKVKQGKCEIPSASDGTEEGERLGLNINDLYLGPGSVDAIEGCVLTVSQAVDLVCRANPASSDDSEKRDSDPSTNKAFCVIRPPGHHCGQDAPSGFCYVNNVIVGAMHGYLTHGQDRAIIIDIDLHHGNGTQAILMNLNEASHNEDLLLEGGKPLPPLTEAEKLNGARRRRGWKGFYGSLHDIWSYPCEDGSIDLIKDASVSIAAHGQYVENIHLQPYKSEEDFYERLYPRYLAVLDKAKQFLEETQADPEHTTVFISAGFDACEHELPSMQRHGRKVPVSFYERVTKDITAFADHFARGKVVSVLEGGYSDKALISATMAHVAGFFPQEKPRARWWQESALSDIERATRKKRNGQTAPFPKEFRDSAVLKRSYELLGIFSNWGTQEKGHPATPSESPRETTARMTLRDRSKLATKEPYSPPVTPRSNPTTARASRKSTDARSTPPFAAQEPAKVTDSPADKQRDATSPPVATAEESSQRKFLTEEPIFSASGRPSAVDILDIKAEVLDESSHREKVILKFKNPASQRIEPGMGTLEKPYVPVPPQKTGIHLGLRDMQKLVSLLRPLLTPYIHIAGTNGKGSVSAMIDSCSIVAGLRTGRYNSPHLITPRDAILIDGQPAAQDVYDHHREIVTRTIAEHHLQNSEFEIETATAFSIFANAEPPIDLLLIECGMGGLRDATNVLDKSLQICSILTVVDMDHQKFLGNTIEAIATEKLGITTSGGHLIVSRQIYADVFDIVRQQAKQVGFSYEFADDGLSLELALPGRHQQENAATAVAALNHIRSNSKALQIQPRADNISASAIQLGLQKTQWRGRCSWIKLPGTTLNVPGDFPLLVDGAHNESAANSLMNYIDSIRTDEPIVFVVALSQSPPKTPLSVLRPMLSRIRRDDKVLPVQFSTPVAGMPWISNVSGLDIQAAAIACGLSRDQLLDRDQLGTTRTLRQGLDLVVRSQKWGFVVITGSLYLVADAYRLAGV